MFCRYCGNQIADDSVFCQHCGKHLAESEKTTETLPKHWEYMTVVVNFRKGEAGWVAEEAYTAPVAQQFFWNDAHPLIEEITTTAADDGWQPLGQHGPACVALEKYKSAEGHNRVLMALNAVASYGSSLLFARSWKWTAKSITLRWRRSTTSPGKGERIVHLWFNAETEGWESWESDRAKNQWVLPDQADGTEKSRNEQLPVEPHQPFPSPPPSKAPRLALSPLASTGAQGLTEEEIGILQLLAQGFPDKEIARQIGKPGLDINMMALHLCGKLGAKSKADLIQQARERGLLAQDR